MIPPPFPPIFISGTHSCQDKLGVIVSLETSTKTYRTTLQTLTSRRSLLAAYLTDIVDVTKRTPSDIPSPISPLASILNTHLNDHEETTDEQMAGLSPLYLHIFLDRPSAP